MVDGDVAVATLDCLTSAISDVGQTFRAFL